MQLNMHIQWTECTSFVATAHWQNTAYLLS